MKGMGSIWGKGILRCGHDVLNFRLHGMVRRMCGMNGGMNSAQENRHFQLFGNNDFLILWLQRRCISELSGIVS